MCEKKTDGSGKPEIFVVAGPTASGKSAAAIELALAAGGEIVSADSVQVYRGLDIGSAKVTPDEARGVPHHLIDVAWPDEEFTAGDYERLALRAIEEIRARGRAVIVCGGTGLYLNALLYGLDYEGTEDAELRSRLNSMDLAELLELPNSPEYRGLRFEHIDTSNKRRVIRAIEIFLSTGGNIGCFAQKRECRFRVDMRRMQVDRAELGRRIERRVDQMLAAGLIEETKRLIARYGRENKALSSIGYREAGDYLAGKTDRASMRELIIIHTRQYAKRQETWLRKYAPS